MKRLAFRFAIGIVTFVIGISTVWISISLPAFPAGMIVRNAILLGVAQPLPLQPTPVPETRFHDSYAYRFRTVSITEQVTDRQPVAIEFPQLIKPANRREVAFNHFLEERMRKSYAVSCNLRRSEIRKREGRDPVSEWPLKITYEVVYADQRIISLKFTHHATMEGVAHPVDHLETINYDLAQGRPIDLSEMFRPGTGYLSVLDAYSRGRIDERYHDYLCLSDGALGEPKLKHWNLSPEGLMISFDGAQLREPSIAPEVVIVPYELLWDFIGRKSLINRFIDDC
jgi:hypothetical protein